MSSFENFVQCRIQTPLTASATDLALYAAVAPYNLPPEAGGVLVLCDSPGNPSKIEVVRYSHRTELGLYGLQRGQEGTAAVEWTGPTYCYQSLMADDFQALLDSKVDKSVAVSSVAGRTGDVLLGPADVGAQPASTNLTAWAGTPPSAKQDTLVSGTNIKTFNGQSLLGPGDIQVEAGATSVNGKTGPVTLNAADVGAQPASANLTSFATKSAPSGAVVGTTDTQTLTNKTLSAPELTGASFVNGPIRSKVGSPTVGTSYAFFYGTTANYFTHTISANTTMYFSSIPTDCFSMTIEITHTAGTITWPASVKWPNDTAPTLTTGKTHIFIFVTDDGGARWRGAALTNYTN